MTLNELAYNLSTLAGLADDAPTIERMKLLILQTRDMLIRRDYERSSSLPHQLLQTLTLPVTYDRSEGNYLLYRTEPLPTLVSLKGRTDLISVTTSGIVCVPAELFDATLTKYRRFGGRVKPHYAHAFGRLYAWNVADNAELTIAGCFYDPREVARLNEEYDYDESGSFPCTGALAKRITEALMAAELRANVPPSPTLVPNEKP